MAVTKADRTPIPTIADCVTRWNRQGYGAVNDFARVATGAISVTAPGLGDGVCSYELPIADGNTYDMVASLASGGYVQSASDVASGIIEENSPSPSYSPNYTLADDGSISTTASGSAPTFSVADCVARWNRMGYGSTRSITSRLYVAVDAPGTCWYEFTWPTGYNVGVEVTGDESENTVYLSWRDGAASTGYNPTYTVDANGQITG